MSLEILLIPAALAAHAAWQARAEKRAYDAQQVVETRLKDPGMLAQAIRNLGGVAEVRPDGVHGQLRGASLSFTTNQDGLAVARVANVDGSMAEALISQIDADYASQVQTHLYDRLVARAAELGLTVESEHVDEDNTITVTLLTTGAMP